MKKYFLGIVVTVASVLLIATPANASCLVYYTEFQSQQPDLFYEIYENDQHFPGSVCGTDACVTFEKQGQRTLGQFTINPSTTPGFYQNAATSQVPLPGEPDQGPYSLSPGQSLTLESKIKWSQNYDFAGAGAAQGTSGVILWNGAVGVEGQSPEYDQIGFTWASQDVLLGLTGGFTVNSFVDLTPVGISQPVPTTNINEWLKVQLVWSADATGAQSVTYYVDGQFVATHVLPAPLTGLSLEIWNDNQEPTFCDEGLCNTFPTPTQTQSFFVDYVKIWIN